MIVAAPADWAPIAPARDRDKWGAVRTRLGAATVASLIAAGELAAKAPVDPLPLSRWRDFSRSGERTSFESLWYARRARVADLLVAFCLRPDDDLLDPILDLVWAMCEETTWCFPAHDLREFPDPRSPVVDLFASLTAISLSELVSVLGSSLPAPVVNRVRTEVFQRVITPYMDSDAFVWLYNSPGQSVSNWTAVCAFGAAGSACYLEEDPQRLATVLVKAARSLEEYVELFDPDGGTSEGTGYWEFGFGAFCQLAEIVERRTGGQWNWFDTPVVSAVATFPLRSRLTVDSWPSFSDADKVPEFGGSLVCALGERFLEPGLTALGASEIARWGWRRSNSSITEALRSVWVDWEHAIAPMPPLAGSSEYFRGLQWLLSRADPADPATLAFGVKGGHNAEMHNQNDLGSLIVRVGGETLVVDPGRGLYTREYFNEHRYEHFVNRSFGHSVPLPGGVEQQAGGEFRATVLELDRSDASDRIRYDLTGAYPATAHLELLTRTVEMRRGSPADIRLTDRFSFTAPAQAESAFITFATVVVRGAHVVLQGERASLQISVPEGADVTVSHEVIQLSSGPQMVSRVAFRTSEVAMAAELHFRIEANHQ